MSKNNHYNELEQVDQNNPVQNESQENISNPIVDYLERHPKKVFLTMVAILGISIAGSILYSIFKKTEQRPELSTTTESFTLDPLSQGLGGIVKAGTSMSEAMQLKDEIQIILSKKTMTRKDSIQLLSAFERLERINKSLIPNNKH